MGDGFNIGIQRRPEGSIAPPVYGREIPDRELSQLKRLINDIDPEALVVVTDTLEVMGHRIGKQPHW